MTARLRSDMTNILTGVVTAGSTPPIVETQTNLFLDLIDSSYFSTDTLPSFSPAVGTPLPIVFGVPVFADVNIPDAAGTNTYQVIMPFKGTLIGIDVNKSVAGAGNTIQITQAGGTAITDAIVAAVDKAVTHVGTIDPAVRDFAAGDILKIVAVRAAGSMLCKVRFWVIKTP